MLCFKQCIDSYFLIAAYCLNKSKIVVILLTLNNSKKFCNQIERKTDNILLRITTNSLSYAARPCGRMDKACGC